MVFVWTSFCSEPRELSLKLDACSLMLGCARYACLDLAKVRRELAAVIRSETPRCSQTGQEGCNFGLGAIVIHFWLLSG